MAAKDKQTYKYEIPLDGKLVTRDAPSKIGPNFQQLTNMRYTPNAVKGIGGMTKINSSVMNATYLKTRSGIHFRKDQPSESHVLVDAFNSGETASRILQNTTSIPSTGNFSATTLYTPTTTTPGRWSNAPDGDIARCDGTESLIWGGTEREMAGFVNYDPDGSFSYDYTEELRNTSTASTDIATLYARSSGIDSSTVLLLHFDNNVTDSSTTPHTPTNNNVTFSTIGALAGYHALFNGTSADVVIADHDDFDFSDGEFTVDVRVTHQDYDEDYSIYYQNTTNDDDSINILIDTNGAVVVRIKDGGTKQFSGGTDFSSASGVIPIGGSHAHIEVVESGDNWYIFVDGELKGYTSDGARAANYTGNVVLGYDGTTYYYGYMEEYRISDTARHTSDFEIPVSAYSTSSTELDLYIAAVRPLDGFKLYVDTANTAASTMTGWYWDGSGWVQVSSLSDGTSVSSKSLAQTGTVTFTSTASTAKLKYFEGVLAYWYKIVVSASSGSPALYYATVSAPFQSVKDIWDGAPRLIDSFQIYKTDYTEATLNVRENEYDSLNTGTFVALDSLTASTQWFICGFTEKMSGVIFNLVNGKENSTANTIVSIDYWDGSDWTSVGGVDDGTLSGGASLGKNGAMTWQPPTAEFRQAINAAKSIGAVETQAARAKHSGIKYNTRFTQSTNNDVRLYYYRFKFSQNLDAEVEVYNISGIPAQTRISAFKFPFFANDRLWLCSDQNNRKNSVICSADGSSSVFNGDDSYFFDFGDNTELTGAAWIFSSVGSSIYNVMMFFKRDEIMALIGNDPDEWINGKYKISSTIGCVAPETIKVIDIIDTKLAQTLNRNVVIWQAADGIYISDGRTPIKISEDIDDKFDQLSSSHINSSEVGNSVAFWDNNNKCYHWCWASGSNTDLDQEWVFDFKKGGWFNVSRGSALQYGIEVKDTYGNHYNYGFLDTGYMERLEYGTDFDGTDITQTMWIGDNALVEGSITSETEVTHTGLIARAKTSTSNNITFTHYGDGNSTGETSWTKSAQKSGYNIITPVQHHGNWPASIFHSVKSVLITDDENTGFEPLYLYMLYKPSRSHETDYK